MPVPDQVRDDGSGIYEKIGDVVSYVELLDGFKTTFSQSEHLSIPRRDSLITNSIKKVS